MFDAVCIFGAQYLYLVSLAIAAGYFLYAPVTVKKQLVIISAIALPIIFILTQVSAHIYYDPRPFVVGHFTPLIPHEPDNGFPSDHTLLATYATLLLYPYAKKISTLLLAFAIIIGFSRIYVGIHHVIDIMGSVLIVLVATASAYFIHEGKMRNPT